MVYRILKDKKPRMTFCILLSGPIGEEDSVEGAVTETTHKRLRLQTVKEQWIYALTGPFL